MRAFPKLKEHDASNNGWNGRVLLFKSAKFTLGKVELPDKELLQYYVETKRKFFPVLDECGQHFVSMSLMTFITFVNGLLIKGEFCSNWVVLYDAHKDLPILLPLVDDVTHSCLVSSPFFDVLECIVVCIVSGQILMISQCYSCTVSLLLCMSTVIMFLEHNIMREWAPTYRYENYILQVHNWGKSRTCTSRHAIYCICMYVWSVTCVPLYIYCTARLDYIEEVA